MCGGHNGQCSGAPSSGPGKKSESRRSQDIPRIPGAFDEEALLSALDSDARDWLNERAKIPEEVWRSLKSPMFARERASEEYTRQDGKAADSSRPRPQLDWSRDNSKSVEIEEPKKESTRRRRDSDQKTLDHLYVLRALEKGSFGKQ